MPLAKARHIPQPDAGAVRAGIAEGGGLAGLGNARLQGQFVDRSLMACTLQFDAIAQLVFDGAGRQIAANVQLAAEQILGEGGQLPFAAIAGIAAQQVILQQAALVGAVLGVIAVQAQGELIRQQMVEAARLPAQLGALGALGAVLAILANLPFAIGLGHFARPLIPLGIVLEVVEFEAQQVVLVQGEARAGGGTQAIQIRRDAALVIVGGLVPLPARDAQQVFCLSPAGGTGGAQLLLVAAAIMQDFAAEVGILPLQIILRLLGGDDDGAADGV
ncbi:hypothetical protein CDAIGKPJ_02581 [Aeromonas salmonicida]